MEPIKKLVKQASVQVDRERDAFARSLGITGAQLSTIDFLSNQKNNSADQNAIEHEFGIKRSTTTIMLQRMEKHGLIQRITDSHDKRRKKVQLTSKSLELVEPIKNNIAQEDKKFLGEISPQERKIVTKILEMIIDGGSNESK